MSVPMTVDESGTEEVPLDLTVKKKDNCAVLEVEEYDDPGELTEVEQLEPLDLSVVREFPLQPLPSQASKPRSQRKDYWSLNLSSPLMETEHLASLQGMYSNAAVFQSPAIPEYNPFLPIFPTSADTQFHQHNHIQDQLQHLHTQQQHQLQLQLDQLHKQKLHLHQLHKQKLQLHTPYGGIPLDPALMMSGSPENAATSLPFSSESNHFPFSGFDSSFFKPAYAFGYPYCNRTLDGRVTGDAYVGVNIGGNQSDYQLRQLSTTYTTTTEDNHHSHHHHHQQVQQQDLDPEHGSQIREKDDMEVVDPEEVEAIYRQSDFFWFRLRYMESLGRTRNFKGMRRSRNNSNNSSENNNDGDHGLAPGQQQYDQSYVKKRQRINEAAKRSRDAKRQKYIENQIRVMYLTKKLREMKEIKERMLKTNNNIFPE